jgi:hypothetical protein
MIATADFVDEIDAVDATDEPIRTLLARDLREAAATLGLPEVRYLVSFYYDLQHYRIAAGQQRSQLEKAGDPHHIIDWAHVSMHQTEKTIGKVLDYYTRSEPTGMGMWARGIVGIGPIISAGLLAHIDIEQAPTVGHIWRFAGLDPSSHWEKKTKRPWNAALKVLCWKAGESFVKVQGRKNDVYGQIYASRRKLEDERNERGDFAEQARAALEAKRFRESTDAFRHYSQGHLPPAHVYARAKRYAVKLFLSHWHAEAYRRHFGVEPPLPYPIAILGHADLIERPNPTR